MDIIGLGFDSWFPEKADASQSAGLEIARVTAVNKDSYLIRNGTEDIFAEITGKMLFNADSPTDFPTVGDWVYAQLYDNGEFAIIHEIISRKSVLQRKTAGKKTEYQLIAANIDTAFIVQSFGSDYNPRRLERYLVMINEGGIDPVVLLSKSDLLAVDERKRKIADIQKVTPGIQTVEFSNTDHYGIDRIKELLLPGKTYCLLGSSGVGKTTLLNNLTNQFSLDTNTVREKDGKGRHTTTRRQLIVLENGAMVIDTPGMRELGNIAVSAGIDATFDEIAHLSEQCLYKNCSHTNEKGCAILNGLAEGTVSEDRYQNFIRMKKETAYNEMSYFEKRRKDKNFGKMCKSIMKNKKHKR
jgi:ribosome biogenesis GTPase